MQYRLVPEIHASDDVIQSLAGGEGNIVVGSASNAPMAKRFRITASTLNALPDFVEVGTEILHDHWVTAVTTLAPSVNETYPDGAFMAEPLEETRVAGRDVPIRWRGRLPDRDLDAEGLALMPKAWMDVSIPYWEGPVGISGSHSGRKTRIFRTVPFI